MASSNPWFISIWSTSGVGGCLVIGGLGIDLTGSSYTESALQDNHQDPYGTLMDVIQWRLQISRMIKRLPMSGTLGWAARRAATRDFRYSVQVPYDYRTPQDVILRSQMNPRQSFSQGSQSCCTIRFNLTDVLQEPMLSTSGLPQRYYLVPASYLESATPILNSAGDVIRLQIEGSGSGPVFLFPDDQVIWQAYSYYMNTVQWQT